MSEPSPHQQHGPGEGVGDPQPYDVLVVGAGFAGMYLLHRLRQLGRRVRVFEAGTDVGGTWYWNRYPGARCDVPSMEYSYSFDPELEQEWEWTEVMASQPEILAYARHVADRYDLRSDISFETRVEQAIFDEVDSTWTLTTDGGQSFVAPFAVMATGCLSVPNTPDLAGLDRFDGTVLHTGSWPKEPPSLAGKRVAIIGTGSSGVQAIPELAAEAGHLTVYQRTPVFTFPANNKPLRPDVQEAYKEHYDEVREMQRTSVAGFSGFRPLSSAVPSSPPAAATPGSDEPAKKRKKPRPEIMATTAAEREEAFARRGFGVFQYYRDVYRDLDANELACDLYRDHVRRTVDDPEVAERLAPTDYPLGCKRQVLDSGYYETFNRPNVDLIDLEADPLVSITETGIETSSDHRDHDVLVLATGFDAMTGALARIDIRGREGRPLTDAWAGGPRTYLGLQVAGFPNLFTVTGPGSPSVLSNMIVAIEHHVDWIADCLVELEAQGAATIEPTEAAQEGWVEHVNEVAEGTMYTVPSCASWYLGSNIPGKTRVFMPYVGGLGRYRQRCAEIVDAGYEGFVIASAEDGPTA